MEHTITANGIRQGRPGGLILSQLQIGLAACCAIVACLTAFGGGVIVGMWYKASEQITPLSAAVSAPALEKSSPTAGAASQAPAEQPVTFYNTLTGNQVAYAPLTPQPTPPGQPAGTPGAAKTPQPQVVAVSPSREVTAGSAKAAPTPTSKATVVPSTGGTKAAAVANAARAAVASEAQKNARAFVAPKPVPLAAAVASAAPKPSTRERQPVATARRPASAAPAPAAASKAAADDYSVQVGSFGNSEQAERLRTNLAQKGYPVRVQLSEVPGQGLRYRVRVGNYADRVSADQSAHHLTAQEQVPAIVAGKN